MAATATVAVASVTTKLPTNYTKPSINLYPNSLINVNSFSCTTLNCFSPLKIATCSFHVRAFNSNGEDDNPAIDSSFFTDNKEDISYLLKLGVGTFAGAAVIKYGSALFPEITKPNICQALLMIFAPVVITIFILVNKSRVHQ